MDCGNGYPSLYRPYDSAVATPPSNGRTTPNHNRNQMNRRDNAGGGGGVGNNGVTLYGPTFQPWVQPDATPTTPQPQTFGTGPTQDFSLMQQQQQLQQQLQQQQRPPVYYPGYSANNSAPTPATPYQFPPPPRVIEHNVNPPSYRQHLMLQATPVFPPPVHSQFPPWYGPRSMVYVGSYAALSGLPQYGTPAPTDGHGAWRPGNMNPTYHHNNSGSTRGASDSSRRKNGSGGTPPSYGFVSTSQATQARDPAMSVTPAPERGYVWSPTSRSECLYEPMGNGTYEMMPTPLTSPATTTANTKYNGCTRKYNPKTRRGQGWKRGNNGTEWGHTENRPARVSNRRSSEVEEPAVSQSPGMEHQSNMPTIKMCFVNQWHNYSNGTGRMVNVPTTATTVPSQSGTEAWVTHRNSSGAHDWQGTSGYQAPVYPQRVPSIAGQELYGMVNNTDAYNMPQQGTSNNEWTGVPHSYHHVLEQKIEEVTIEDEEEDQPITVDDDDADEAPESYVANGEVPENHVTTTDADAGTIGTSNVQM